MIEFVALDSQVTDDVPKTAPACQLTQTQRNELAPATHLAQLLALVVVFRVCFKFMSRNQFEQLSENGAIVSQGLNPLCLD